MKTSYSRSYLENVLKRFFFLILSLDWMFGLFMYVDKVLTFILNILNLNNFFKIKLNFYAISNNCVNAKFLSRYIARKFAHIIIFMN